MDTNTIAYLDCKFITRSEGGYRVSYQDVQTGEWRNTRAAVVRTDDGSQWRTQPCLYYPEPLLGQTRKDVVRAMLAYDAELFAKIETE